MKYYNYPNTTEVAENVDSKNISQYGGGGSSGYFIANVEEDSSALTLDKTFSEIFNARDAGKTIMLVHEAKGSFNSTPVLEILANSATNMYGLAVCMEMTVVAFTTNDPDGYPAFSPDDSNN